MTTLPPCLMRKNRTNHPSADLHPDVAARRKKRKKSRNVVADLPADPPRRKKRKNHRPADLPAVAGKRNRKKSRNQKKKHAHPDVDLAVESRKKRNRRQEGVADRHAGAASQIRKTNQMPNRMIVHSVLPMPRIATSMKNAMNVTFGMLAKKPKMPPKAKVVVAVDNLQTFVQ